MRPEVDYDTADFNNVHSRQGVSAKFYIVPKENHAESEKAGRPVFEDKEYVQIIAAGNSTNIVERPVTDLDRNRFKEEYRLFKKGAEQLVGTPLAETTFLTRSQIEDLSYLRVRTVEQLAEMADSACAGQAGVYELRRKARTYLEKATVGAAADKVKALEDTVAALQQQLAALSDKPDAKKAKGA